jgi:hypothetical protein
MSRDKSPRPASLTEAISNFNKAKATFDSLVTEAIKESESGDAKRAEVLIKEGHTALLAVKDTYNRMYGQIQSAARTKKADETPAPKEDKPAAASTDADKEDV